MVGVAAGDFVINFAADGLGNEAQFGQIGEVGSGIAVAKGGTEFPGFFDNFIYWQ